MAATTTRTTKASTAPKKAAATASTVRGLAGTIASRNAVERELRRYERRGASARTRLQRGVRERRDHVGRLVNEAQDRIGTLTR